MAIQATGRATFTAVEDYDIVFALNGVQCDTLNFDSVRSAESAVLEADFTNGGAPCVVDRAVLACYDGEGTLMGSSIEVHDSSSAVADGGNLYLSKDCRTISCEIYQGEKRLCARSMTVVRNGSGVSVKAVAYKVINNVAAGAALNWDSVQSQANYPTQKPDKGKYCYVMTIVLYTDGTTTNSVSTSYTPTDGNNGTSVTIKDTKVEYAGGDNGTTAPASGWNTSVPQLGQGKFLWTRTTVVFSDGKSTVSYSVGRIGMDGAKGGTTHILYASSDKPQSAADVRTTIDAMHQYYGTYQDTDINDHVEKYTSVTSWVLIKGDKGDTPTVAKLRVNYSACHFSRTSNTWDHDSVTVTIVIMDGSKITIPAYGDTSRYYWRLSTDSTDTMRASGWGFNPSLNAPSYTLSLYKTGGDANLPLDTITVPFIVDGKDGDGTPATVYTIEPFGSIEASGTLKDGSHVTVTIKGEVRAYKITGDSKVECSTQPQCWKMSVGSADYDSQHNNSPFSNNASNNIISFTLTQDYDISSVPGSANITFYKDNTLQDQLASLIVPISLNPNAIQDINAKLGTIQQTTTNMQNTVNGMHGTIETIRQGHGAIELKVQDLQNGGIDTSKPHTSSQVDFTSLSTDNFYPVLIRFEDDGGKRHTVEINRPLDAEYGNGKSYMTHGRGFSFQLIFSDIANDWGSREDGLLRIESILQGWTTPTDTPICPRIAQYYPFSFMVAWLRGGSKYDITVDCTDAYISGIWPYMTQVASNPSLVPDAVRLAPNTWTTAQVNAQGGNPYNLLKKDNGGYYADTDNEYLYRFGKLAAGNTFAIVGQPTDSKQWFMATWHITSVSGSKVYVDVSTYGILWQTQNPLGIRMNGVLGYIKNGVSYAKSTWDSQSGFGTTEDVDNTAVHANWVTSRPILVIGKESGTTNGVYRDRAVLESVQSCEENDEVGFFANTYFDVSPLYGTDGRVNVKPDLLATGIDIKSHKITATADNFVVSNNSGNETFSIDKDGSIVGNGNASFKGTVYASGGSFTGTVTASEFSLISDKFTAKSDGTFKLDMTHFKVNESGIITAKGGSISFLKFDEAGMYGGVVSYSTPSYCTGVSLTSTNISVGGSGSGFLSNVFLGNGRSDFRTSKGGVLVRRVGGSASNFYNYIRLTNTGAGSFSVKNEDAALGVETDGNFCVTALGGPSAFQGLCLPSSYGSSMTADGKRTMYRCSGGTFKMPSNPPADMVIIVIQTTNNRITFDGNGHSFRSGNNTNSKADSSIQGQWTVFFFNGSEWETVYFNGRPW